jgi:hypothetical protein
MQNFILISSLLNTVCCRKFPIKKSRNKLVFTFLYSVICAKVLGLLIFFPGRLSKTFSADSQSALYSEFFTPLYVRLALFGRFEENSHKMAKKTEKSVLVCKKE